jgi:endonuclease/exonuclease/phosphatase family metal-dependent hydrolase
MRLATWNVWSGRTRGRDDVDEGQYAADVGTLDADVLALQEVDRSQPRSQGLDLAGIAARAMGAVDWRFAPALTGTPDRWRPATSDADDDRPAYGIALLSRYPVTGWTVIPLRGAPVRVPYRWPGSRLPTLVRDEQRVALVARVASPLGPMTVVATHLSFLPVWNGAQLRRLVREVTGPGPQVLLGDLNMGPSRASRITGLMPLASGPTFPSWSPTRQIDHVLASGRLVSPGGGPVTLSVSDHCALVADLG